MFFRALRRAAPGYAIGWWVLIVMRGMLPAVTSVAFGWLVERDHPRTCPLVGPLVMVGIVLQRAPRVAAAAPGGVRPTSAAAWPRTSTTG